MSSLHSAGRDRALPACSQTIFARWHISSCKDQWRVLPNSRQYWSIAVSSRCPRRGRCRIWVSLVPVPCKATQPGPRAAYKDFFALWKNADSDIPCRKAHRQCSCAMPNSE